MHATVSRIVEDLSAPGVPKLGRAGWTVKHDGSVEAICFDDEFSSPEASKTAAELLASAVEEREAARNYFASLRRDERATIP